MTIGVMLAIAIVSAGTMAAIVLSVIIGWLFGGRKKDRDG
jgi:hypothetical protein